MSTDAAKGKAALDAKDYLSAATHLTAALKTSNSPLWYIQRSTAYQRAGKYELALADADNAVFYATERGRRELIATAHYRRAIAYHGLKRFGDARLCLHWTKKYNDKEKGLTMWIAKVTTDYDAAGGEDAECNAITAMEKPAKVEEVAQGDAKEEVKDVKENTKTVDKGKGIEKAETPAAPKAAPAPTPKEKIRHEWFQSPTSITLEIFAKGIPKDKAEIEIKEGSLSVSFPLTGSDTYDFSIDPFFAPINTSTSKYRITPHKIELTLTKLSPGKWSALEGTSPIPSTQTTEPSAPIPSSILNPPSTTTGIEKPLSYPSSSRTGPKNWDKLGGEDEEAEDDGPDAFFKTLFKNADPDTKRAMMKSYQESNGTALSTDWGDVSKKSFETSPPEGMEAKKWES